MCGAPRAAGRQQRIRVSGRFLGGLQAAACVAAVENSCRPANLAPGLVVAVDIDVRSAAIYGRDADSENLGSADDGTTIRGIHVDPRGAGQLCPAGQGVRWLAPLPPRCPSGYFVVTLTNRKAA